MPEKVEEALAGHGKHAQRGEVAAPQVWRAVLPVMLQYKRLLYEPPNLKKFMTNKKDDIARCNIL